MTTDDSTGIALGLIAFLSFVALYVWTALALSAVFRKCGEEGWKAWVPILNQLVLLQLGRLSPMLFLIVLVPVIGPLIVWALLVVACYRINLAFGYGVGMTVLAALALPIWASVLGFGSARWLGAESAARGVAAAGPRRTSAVDAPGGDDDAFVPRATPGYGASEPPPMPAAAAAVVASFAPAAAPSPAPHEGPADAPTTGPDLAWTPPPVTPTPVAASAPPVVAAPVVVPTPPVPPVPAPEHARAVADTVPAASVPAPVAGRSTLEPPVDAPVDAGRWGGFDLGAVSEVTSEVTGADSAAPAPISAVPMRAAAVPPPLPLVRDDTGSPAPHRGSAAAESPPVTRVPPAPLSWGDTEAEPWAPARSPMTESEAFPETSGHVSAVAGAAAAGTPRSARSTVSAQHTKAEIPEDPIDQTIITRRRRTAWSLVAPSGAVVPITAEVVLLGRKPVADRAHPSAQLIAIDDGTVSKTHARLVLRDEHWYITDLGSTNGVLFATLMGTEVEATPGEEIEAGERFFLGDAEVRLQRSEG